MQKLPPGESEEVHRFQHPVEDEVKEVNLEEELQKLPPGLQSGEAESDPVEDIEVKKEKK